LEAVIPVDKAGTANAKLVATTKIGMKTVIRDATIMIAIVPIAMEAVVATAGSSALRLLPATCLLGTLRSLLVLRLLGMLRLLLALRLLGFPSLSVLFFLLPFLCECRNGDSEK